MKATKVPNVNEHRRIPRRAIRAVVPQIAEMVQPVRALFGSYAYGKPRLENNGQTSYHPRPQAVLSV